MLTRKNPNQNETFNGTIWNSIPKSRFTGYYKQFGLGVLDAADHFNIGNLATLLMYDKMGMQRGFYTMDACYAERGRVSDKNKKQVGSVYGYGKFQFFSTM